MNITSQVIEGVFVIEPDIAADERGNFARTVDFGELKALDIDLDLSLAAVAFNRTRGTLRGIHFQRPPHSETKIVSCVSGTIFDVVVDIREESPTYLRWLSFDLDDTDRRHIVVPPGCAHGYVSLTDNTSISYLMTGVRVPAAERGIAWNDPAVGVAWPIEPVLMSVRDRSWGLIRSEVVE